MNHTAAVLVLLLLVSGGAWAGGFHNEDIGAKRMAMLAVIAKADDATAIYHNPAGLVLSRGTSLYHSQSWFFIDMGMRMYDSKGILHPTSGRELKPSWNVGFIPFLGVATDFGTERWRGGLAVYAPNMYGAAMPEDEPTRYHATKVLFLSSRATASVAFRATRWFSLGANANLVHMYLTAERFMNPLVLQDPDMRFAGAATLAPFDARLRLGGQAWTGSWDAGVLFEPLETLKIGASFVAGARATIRGKARLRYADGARESSSHRTNFVIPFTLKVGINWEFAKDFEIAADYRYYHYQVFQEQRTRLSDPIMGMEEFRDPKDYKNASNWCVGLLYRVIPSLEFMVGYQEDYSPIPDETYTLDNPSRDQRGISLGVRWQPLKRHRFGLAIVRNWFDLVDVQTSRAIPPANAKGHATNFEVGFDYTFWIL
ncbi:MAG: TonB-dependent receptor [Deltaproteobacteria bacterium]|nr:TonB-dependent receptor [Deltaproteobacteria bacterium]